MALRDDFAEQECFAKERGTPTLTIEEDGKQLMVPWISFQQAHWEGEKIELQFSAWRVDLVGNNLRELWTGLQMQSVISIRKSRNTEASGCVIRALVATAVNIDQYIADSSESPVVAGSKIG